MTNLTAIEVCYQLKKSGVSAAEISRRTGRHRATVYRWLQGFRQKGKRQFIRDYKVAKKGHKQPRKTSGRNKQLVYDIRAEYRECCGQKICFILARDYQVKMSLSTIYRILGQKYKIRPKWKHHQTRGKPIRVGTKPREYVQVDTVDLGQWYAFTAIDTYTKEVSVRLEDKLTAKAGERALKQLMNDLKTQHITYLQRDGGPEFKKEWQHLAYQHAQHLKTSRPYKKNDQAFIEKFNATLRKECVGHIKYRKQDFALLQQKINDFLQYYHHKRPHLSLNFLTPHQFSLSHLT